MAKAERWSTQQAQQSRQRQHTVLTALGVVAGLLFLTVIFWQQATNTIPKLEIPNPVMPWRNAHDAYVAAGNALQDKSKVGYAIGAKHSPGGREHRCTQDVARILQGPLCSSACAIVQHPFSLLREVSERGKAADA